MPPRMSSVEKSKMGGIHTTIIGERAGRKIVLLVAAHPQVKKIIPGMIKVKGPSGGNLRAKVLRPDNRGNLRLLLSQGTSVQEIQVVTTAADFESGEVVLNELNEMIEKELAD
ncbi:DUF2103 domain-containing protein [Methanolapillus millepedarum]|uniref:Metal-binding protein n=1 Tax=Methanolapillus millepedarum TaxID=3028296 RepID=A0AA96V534_9EURY|nr:hypothetical protein MsAc7_16520 [Methanosarcinaceae archaeon Ac7]